MSLTIQKKVHPMQVPAQNQDQSKKSQLIVPKGNMQYRHFKALMRKNAINWRRTCCGSILEILCPAFLMLILVYARYALKSTTFGNTDMYALQKPIYPTTTFNQSSQSWITQPTTPLGASLVNFLNFTAYSGLNTTNTSQTYNPLTDLSGPYNFFPQHCVKRKSGPEFNSPLIGYIPTGSQIEKDFIAQLNVMFAQQKLIAASLMKTSSVSTPSFQQFQQKPQLDYSAFGNFTIKAFENIENFKSYIGSGDYGTDSKPGVCFGFKLTQNNPADYELELMFYDLWPDYNAGIPSQVKPPADPSIQKPNTKSYDLYMKEGYAYVQNWVANTILKRATNNSNAQIAAVVVPLQSLPGTTDIFSQVLATLFPLFMILMYVPLLYRVVYRIVNEKVTRAKESMRMMGLGDFAYWSSWLAYFTIINTAITIIVWAILLINVYNKKSAFLLFVMVWLYGQSLFGLVLIIQSIFSSPRAAAITTTIVYFGTSLFSTLISNDGTTREAKIAVYFFFPVVTMAQCFQPFIQFDFSIGMTFQTWQLEYFQTTVLTGVVMQIIGGINMFLLGIYLEQVLPKTYGDRKHPLFFLGCSSKKKGAKQISSQVLHNSVEIENKAFETQYANPDYCEPVGIEQIRKEESGEFLKIQDLKKTYENGFKAVDGINLKMYSDQIFVLLGHNGAGKTSTISMLSGLFGASEGEVELFGTNALQEMQKVRQVMGVCPQYDVLFELLTTEEHLSFFYDLKGADPKLKKQEIEQLMKDVGVDDKRNALAYQLSGGNKRKLSVAIALCGGSKFVLLDEPTSGMDLSARRQLWNMLKAQKKDRIILLTTHYMDEADILGDRIAIMAKGKISCVGSSIFLKNKFGVGYNLTLVKSNTDKSDSILPYLKSQLGEKVTKQSEIQSEMTVQIPHEYDSNFARFFEKFDQDLAKLQIRSYGISITTLEEVFLKVGHLEDPLKIDMASPLTLKHEDLKTKDIEEQTLRNDEFNLKDNIKDLDESFFNNLLAVIYRRFSNYRRNKKAIFNEAIIPAIIMVFGVTISQISTLKQSPSRIQEPSRLSLPQTVIFNPTPILNTDTPVSSLIKNLPQASSAFNIKFDNYTAGNYSALKMPSFGQYVFDYGTQKIENPPFVVGSYQIYQADRASQQYKFVSFVNLTSQDAPGLYPQFMYQSILKTATNNSNFNFTVRSTPYPPTSFVKIRLVTTSASTLAFIGGIAYGMMITAVVSYLVVERLEGLKHLQLISGMQLKAYWIGNFIFDFAKMYFTIIVTVILFFGYSLDFKGSTVVYLVFPFGILPFTYVTSFIFTADSAAQTFTMFLHFLIYSIASVIIFFIRFSESLQVYGDGLDRIFRVIPSYMLGQTLFCDSTCQSLAQARKFQNGKGKQLSPDKWDITNIPSDIIALFVHFLFWTFILILIEKGYFSWCRLRPNKQISQKAVDLDEDVLNEQKRVQEQSSNDVITVQNFKKVYSQQNSLFCWDLVPMIAVSNLNFGLNSGECFALLGVNGAGKSTTFKSLTHEVLPTSGQIKIGGFDLNKDFEKARKLIGYCPQPNLVFETMTVEEHIYFYAMIKGIPRSKRSSLVEQAIQQLGLQDHRKKLAGTLSGGNKRKLCVAQALVGNPPIILLDEPSAGMDPEARRFMWTVVAGIAQRKTSAVVLTTHSMDEAEALSTKMGIMIKGGIFQCFGSSQHIKNKFGTGFVVEIKIRTLEENELEKTASRFKQNANGELDTSQFKFEEKIKSLIATQSEKMTQNERTRQIHGDINLYLCILELCGVFKQVELLEKFGNYIKVRFQKQKESIGTVFGLIEKMKQSFEVSEYSVGQTTLEQIFQSFAEQHYVENIQKFEISSSGGLLSLVQ